MHLYVVSAEATPRVLLHVSTRIADAASEAGLGLSIATEDRDTDDHLDVRVDVDVPSTGGTTKRVPLLWLDRPSGLARDAAEPEQTLSALAAAASAELAKQPERALSLSQAALDLHARLCRESGRAQLEVDDEPGVSCGASTAAGRAAVIAVVALTRKRALLPALEARARLESPAFRIDDAQRARSARALATLPGDTEFVWRKGPALPVPSEPHVRLPAIGWSDEEHLLLRGAVAQSYDLRTQAVEPTALSGSVLVNDGRGGPTVVDIVRSCDGRRLRVAQLAEGSLDLTGRVLSAGASAVNLGALVEPGASLAACTPSRVSSDRAGLQVLGRTAQGLLIARGEALLLVNDAANAQDTTLPRELAATEPAAALSAPGALSADGLHHVLVSSEGVIVIARGATPSVRLVRTPASCGQAPSDAALSPTGTRIAMLCGGQVYVAERGGSTGTAAPGPTEALPNTPTPLPAEPASPSPPPTPVTALPPPVPEPAAPTHAASPASATTP